MKFKSSQKSIKTIVKIAGTLAGTVATLTVVKSANKKLKTEDKSPVCVCPACTKKHKLTHINQSVMNVKCDACGSICKVDLRHIHTSIVNENNNGHLCKECIYYKNEEGNWYYTRGGGTCSLDTKVAITMKMPNSHCHNGKFTHK